MAMHLYINFFLVLYCFSKFHANSGIKANLACTSCWNLEGSPSSCSHNSAKSSPCAYAYAGFFCSQSLEFYSFHMFSWNYPNKNLHSHWDETLGTPLFSWADEVEGAGLDIWMFANSSSSTRCCSFSQLSNSPPTPFHCPLTLSLFACPGVEGFFAFD